MFDYIYRMLYGSNTLTVYRPLGSVLVEEKPAGMVDLTYSAEDVAAHEYMMAQVAEFLQFEGILDGRTGQLVARQNADAPTFSYKAQLLLDTNFEALSDPEAYAAFVDRSSDNDANQFMARMRDFHTLLMTTHDTLFLTKYITKLYGSLERLSVDRQDDTELLAWPDVHVAHPTLWIIWTMSYTVFRAAHLS